MKNESDHHHLLLLKGTIDSFQKAPLTLEGLLEVTRKIEELLDVLKEINPEWKESFRTEWWELEYISSMMIDEETEEFTEEDRKILAQAFATMKEMLSDPRIH